MSENIFGQLPSEKFSVENEDCRKIVQEVINFGVNQRQIKFIIYLLSLHIDDPDLMREFVGLVKEACPDVFVAQEE